MSPLGSARAPSDSDLTTHDLRKRQILEQAAAVFYERGFAAGTTKEIASRVGLTQPAIYHYVGSKETLLREIALQVRRDMNAALERALAPGHDALAQLRRLIAEFTAAIVANRMTFTVYLKEQDAIPDDLREVMRIEERAFVERVAGIVKQLQDADVLPPGPTRVITEAVLGMITWVHQWYRPDAGSTPAQIAEMFLATLALDEGSPRGERWREHQSQATSC